ncbi:MAG: DUF4423 domain-containing protein [Fibrobacter sp.]|nr:DUF4423 domain-containing protein [Fibrobacter sp.]
MLPVINFNNKYEEIGRFFDPPLSPKQVKQSIELLLRLGLLKKESSGRYSATSTAITTGDEVKQVGLAAFHKSCLQLAIRSLYAHPQARRDISGVTLSISQKAFEQIKEEISAFRKKIMTIAHEDSDEDTVYQFNLQLFPLTHTRKK